MTKSSDSTISKSVNYRLFSRIFWAIFILGVSSVILLFVLIKNGAIGYMPPYEEIENPTEKYATRVFSSDMQQLFKYYYTSDNRTFVPYDSLSANVVKALIATEDERFVSHSGIDARSLFRVLVRTMLFQQENSGGGSTITQQLAKQLYTEKPARSTFERGIQKFNEWVIAVELERYYTKEEIISLYLNQFDFLYNAIGIKTAARVYFDTTPDKLTIEQSAILVGMLKNPSLYNPRRFPENMIGRRNVVYGQMVKANYLSTEAFDTLKTKSIKLDFKSEDHKQVTAAYFRQYLAKTMNARKPDRKNYAGWQNQLFYEDSIEWVNNPLFGWCNKNLKPDGEPYNLYSDGLRIYTTLDSRMQKYAEDAVVRQLKETLQPAFFNSLDRRGPEGKAIAPYDTDIAASHESRKEKVEQFIRRTMVYTDKYRNMKSAGKTEAEIDSAFHTKSETSVFTWNGIVDTVMSPWDSIIHMKKYLRSGMMSMDPLTGHVKAYVGGPNFSFFQYDMVTQGRRQVGSTIKPFLYTLAMQEGLTPCYKVRNVPYTQLDGLGRPWTPRNVGKARYGEMVTLKWGLAQSNNFISSWVIGQFKPKSLVKLIQSMGVKSPMDAVPSLCLGPADFSIKELVAAYSVFANKGVYTDPIFVTRIEDNNGNIISTFGARRREVIDENTAYLMINLLEGVVNIGTGYKLRSQYGFTAEMGGKTGTTQNYSDGWFSGVTPRLVTAVWVGGEERSIRFDSSMGYGGVMSLPIWADYMQHVYDDESLNYTQEETFEKPVDFNIDLDCTDETIQVNGDAGDDNSTSEPEAIESLF